MAQYEIERGYAVSDGNAAEVHMSWDDTVEAVRQWYDFMTDDDRERPEEWTLPAFDDAGLAEGDVTGLNEAIREWEERIAASLGFTAWYGHGSYEVAARCEAGLNLTVTEEV